MTSKRQHLVDIFLTKNNQINLSAIRDEEGVRIKHIADSLELTKIVDLSAHQTLMDVGTWWGFPLLALALYAQEHNLDLQLIGLDARRKKTLAVQEMAGELWLDNTQTLRSRAEDHHQRYDIVTARAVAHVDTLLDWIVPLCEKGWLICLYKEFKQTERAALLKHCKTHHLTLVKEHHYRLFDWDIERVLYILQK